MAWIPLLTAGASLLSGFLGKGESSRGQQNTHRQGTETTSLTARTDAETQQQQNQSQQTAQQSSQQSTQETRTDQFGNTISEQLASTIGQQTGTSVGSVNRLDAVTQGLLTARVQEALGNTGGGAAALTNRLAEIEGAGIDFDPEAFVSGIMSQARSVAGFDQESGLSRIRSAGGVTGRGNSAAALLENRLANDTAANLAGIEAAARGQASQIMSEADASRTSQIAGLAGGLDSSVNALVNSLMQASQVESQQTAQQQSSQTAQTGTEQSQQSSVTGQTGTTTSQTTGTTDTQTTGTESTTQKQQQVGATESASTEKVNSSGSTKTGGGLEGLLQAAAGMFTAEW